VKRRECFQNVLGVRASICRFSKRRHCGGLNPSASTKIGRCFGITFDLLAKEFTKDVPPAFLAGLRNASLLNDGATIRSCDNIFLCDPAHHASCIYSGQRPPLVLPPVDLKLSGEYIHFGALWGLEQYHWVFDVLPRLSFVERFDRLRGLRWTPFMRQPEPLVKV
jgi:hypothetical protein